jgi:phosphoglycolate phosphatase
MKKFWFFDLDGTLADTDRDIRLAWRAAMDDLGISCPDFETRFVAGPPIEEMAKALFPEIYTDELGRRLRERFGAHYDNDGFPETKEYPGVMDRVRALKKSGAKVYIVTNKRYVGAMAMAEKFGWVGVFDGIYAGDMYKDDPSIGKLRKGELLKRVMNGIGARAEECAMVGDTMSDFTAAKECGIESVGVAWGYGKPEELACADRIVNKSEEV